jgi:parallel beta-helix repeat protein
MNKMKSLNLKIVIIFLSILIVQSGFNISNSKSLKPILNESFSSDLSESYLPTTKNQETKNFEKIIYDYISGEIIVKFKNDFSFNFLSSNNESFSSNVESLNTLNKKHNIVSCNRLYHKKRLDNFSNIYKLKFPKNCDLISIIEDYNNNPFIEYAEPNYIYHFCNIPNDHIFSEQWSLNQSNDHDIDCPEAWNITTGDSDIVIAIVDSGVDCSHPDIIDNIWENENEIPGNGLDDDNNGFVDDIKGWNFYSNTSNPIDYVGHGTHCAGIASAVTNNGIGIAGVCWNCSIMPLKIGTDIGCIESAANAIIYAADNDADVISMSWGGGFDSILVRNALNYAYNKGVVLVGASGNNNFDFKFYPAAFENVIAVAATDENDKKATFSNYGAWVDVAAPGVNILSLRANNTSMGNVWNDNYTIASGTSMACPHVAGLVGLILSKNNSLNQNMIESILCNSVDKIESDESIGRGRINAFKALLSDPIESILNPFPNGGNVDGIISIIGSASGKSFQKYTLEYGKGKNPDFWINLITSTTAIQNGVLSILNTSEIEEGYYTIKLNVTCKNSNYIDTTFIVVNNKYNYFTVDDHSSEVNFSRIQDAIDNAGDNDEIFVFSGGYNETVKIYRSIILTGEDKTNTIIKGYNNDDLKNCIVLNVEADNVTIKEFTVIDSRIGVLLYSNAKNCKIFRNIFKDNWQSIFIQSSGCKIYDNVMSGDIWLFWARNNFIFNNSIKNDGDFGVYVLCSNENFIFNNDIENQSIGIELRSLSNRNVIFENNITKSKFGIRIYEESNKNLIYHNILKNNIQNANDSCANFWDNGYSSGGNYWDDYFGKDKDGDGIGDSAYNIPEGNNKDRYPLGIFDNEPPNIKIIKPNDGLYIFNKKIRNYLIRNTLIVGNIEITINISDNESGIEKFEFYIDNDLKYCGSESTYSYVWVKDRIRFFNHMHKIRIIAYDKVGNTVNNEINVWKFL